MFQGYSILKYTAILVVCQSERSDKDWVYCHPNMICSSECPHSPFYVIIILFLHGIIAIVEFHLAHVDNFVCPFYNEIYLCLFLFGLRCCPWIYFGKNTRNAECLFYLLVMVQTQLLKSQSCPGIVLTGSYLILPERFASCSRFPFLARPVNLKAYLSSK